VVLEEMPGRRRAGVGALDADRQSGPLLLRFGTEAQRQKFPCRPSRVASSRSRSGMSEPDAGSTLASLRTRAERVDGGYRVNGTKVWTSNAHLADYMIATFRSTTTRPRSTTGSRNSSSTRNSGHHDEPDHRSGGLAPLQHGRLRGRLRARGHAVGEEGAGWKQVTTELAFERSGPERYLSSLAWCSS